MKDREGSQALDALTKIRQRNRLHAQLKSGLDVAYHLPDLKRCLVEAEETGGTARRQAWEYFQCVIAEMLDAIDGEELTDRDDRRAIAAALTPEEREELDALAAPSKSEAEGEEPADWEEAGKKNEREWMAAVQ